MIRTGVVFFENLTSGPGWAAHAGATPRPIQHPNDLDNQTIWMTNLEESILYRDGLSKHAFYRNNRYLRLSTQHIAAWLLPPDATQAEQVQVCADVFEHVVTLYQHYVENDAREHWSPHPYSIRSSIREAVMGYDPDLQQSPELLEALGRESRQDYVRTMEPMQEGDSIVPIHIPLVSFAKQILETPVPLSMEIVNIPKPYPQTKEDIQAWLVEIPGPSIVKINIQGLHPKSGKIINFGSIAKQTTTKRSGILKTVASKRRWFTGQDAYIVSNMGDIEILDAYYFPSAAPLIQHQKIFPFFRKLNDIHNCCYSIGLFADNLWQGFLVAHTPNIRKYTSCNIIAPFLRAKERAILIEAVCNLAENGVRIRGYGRGGIIDVFVQPSSTMFEEVISMSIEIGGLPMIMPPPGKVDLQKIREIIDVSTPYGALIEILAAGAAKEWHKFNNYVFQQLMGSAQ